MTFFETRELTKSFNGLTAVDNVSVSIREGELVCVIGPNGAGKTTFVNLVTGMLEPTSGEVLFEGTDVTGSDPHEITQAGISRSFQTASLFTNLTVEENVKVAALAAEQGSFRVNFFRRLDAYPAVTERAQALLERFNLVADRNMDTGSLSYGDKRRLELAVAMANDPRLIFMDEPTAGMSPEETQATTELIKSIQEERTMGAVMIEHDMDLVFDLADRIVVLNRGEIIAKGTPGEIREHPEVQEAYLGGVKQ
ncbi:ABC transporter ATP-binding protein [Halostagnicola sp. A-GB9-2]|uniref:ABC transporter ATP-binding protein n=1 Tax=Halostagnicola sp. A-GB9-2 TaxID=3048066 RepID=UPI0024BFC8D8|nr:ABC transporter ATP-binding protein [Halostagnicola sp. A-GB9-2]MDJ1434761.1 ABC transporter ATP-binding protein [Halostagnicola sp. A-GB9-2]